MYTLPKDGLMKNPFLSICCLFIGCIANTKLENNDEIEVPQEYESTDSDSYGFDSGYDSGQDDVPVEVPAPILLSVDTNFGQVSMIDPQTASTQSIASVSMEYQINTMAVDSDGTAYIYDHLSRKIGLFNPCSGDVELLQQANEERVICGLSFAPNGQLYGIDSKEDTLVLYSLETGIATVVGSLEMDVRSCGLAFDTNANHLIGITSVTNEVFHIDIETGLALNHLTVDVPFAGVGAEYQEETGILFASTGSELYAIDPADGSSILIGALDGHTDDLAYHPDCR